MNRALLYGFIDQGHGLGDQLLGRFLVSLLDGLPELLDLGAEGGLILPVDGVPPDAAAVLPDRRIMLSHMLLLFGAPMIE
jgi:hypothetical protein